MMTSFAAIGLLIFGVLIGYMVNYLLSARKILQAKQLEKKLLSKEADYKQYQQDVAQNMVKTIELFQTLQQDSQALYNQLVDSTQALCNEHILSSEQNTMLGEKPLPTKQIPGDCTAFTADLHTTEDTMAHQASPDNPTVQPKDYPQEQQPHN